MNDDPAAGEKHGNSAPSEKTGALANIFRALGHRNYRLFFGGQGISLIGTWMTRVATSWLVYELTGQDWILGIVSFAGQIPILIFAAAAGVMVENASRIRTLVATQVASMLQSFALAALALSGVIQVWQIIVLAIFQGIINAVDTPTRQAFVVEIVDDRRDLGNAIALNSSMFNGARLIGPAIAGAILAQTGAGICFLIDGISYLAVIAALLRMRVAPRVAVAGQRRLWHELKEGFSYSFRFSPIRAILLLLALVSVVAAPFSVLLPVFAKEILGGDARTYGFLLAASGFGALCGALYLASRASPLGLGRVIVFASGLCAASIIAFAYSTHLWLSLLLAFTASFGMMVHMASSNTILQTIVDDDKRARVMSFYTMTVLGMLPIGSLVCAGIVARFGAPLTVSMGGCLSLVGTAAFASQLPKLRAAARPSLVRAGLLPPLSSGLQSAVRVEEVGAP
jgi:MFS family permease